MQSWTVSHLKGEKYGKNKAFSVASSKEASKNLILRIVRSALYMINFLFELVNVDGLRILSSTALSKLYD
jgi:hypothetical protein